jgi:hypothetical protein
MKYQCKNFDHSPFETVRLVAGLPERAAESMQITTGTSAAAIFFGRTQVALALKGRRVRRALALSGASLYDRINRTRHARLN